MKKLLKIWSWFFRKTDIDWLDEQSYFSRYWIYKLRRLIMNVIYKIWDTIDELILEKYLTEIEFTNEEKTFKATLKYITLCKNHEEAEFVREQVIKSLTNTYSFSIGNSILHKKILTPEALQIEKNKIIVDIQSHKTFGYITFDSYVGIKTKVDTINKVFPSLQEQGFNSTIKPLHKKDINFSIVKNSTKHLYQNDKYLVRIEYLKESLEAKTNVDLEPAKQMQDRLGNLDK